MCGWEEYRLIKTFSETLLEIAAITKTRKEEINLTKIARYSWGTRVIFHLQNPYKNNMGIIRIILFTLIYTLALIL